MNKFIAGAVLMLTLIPTTTAIGAITLFSDPSALQGTVRTVTFDGLGQGTSFTYAEAGLTLSDLQRRLERFNVLNSYNGDFALRQDYPTVLYSFSTPLFEAGWDEYQGSASHNVRLFSDAAGTQLIGEYPVAPVNGTQTYKFQGFRSDVAFQSLMFPGGVFTAVINNMRYTPEPTAMLGTCGVALLYAGRGVLGRRRK